MKKVLLTLAVLGTIFTSACEKNESIVPIEKSLIKADKGILCRGCGDWDLNTPTSTTESSTLRITGPSDTTKIRPIIPGRRNR